MRTLAPFIIISGFLICGCFHFTPDNPIEEMAEEIIEQATGLDIDLSADDEKI